MLLACSRRCAARPPRCPRGAAACGNLLGGAADEIAGDLHEPLREFRVRAGDCRDGNGRRDVRAPDVEPLVKSAAARARGEVVLRALSVALGAEPEGVTRDERLAVGAAAPGETDESPPSASTAAARASA